MNLVVDQVNDNERAVMDDERVKECIKRYTTIFGDFPEADAEVTVEQLTAMDGLLQDGGPPYADFSIWGPHGSHVGGGRSFAVAVPSGRRRDFAVGPFASAFCVSPPPPWASFCAPWVLGFLSFGHHGRDSNAAA